ncbi:MAG: helix-turn-helix transcriptional regulator [Cyanobacteria bacterium P01_D01_bin.1]
MKVGSKYYPLFEYLRTHAVTSVSLTFAEIEAILQSPLPKSSRQRAWWSNRDSASALQAGAWIQAGYQVESIDFEQERVTFLPFQASYHIQRKDGAILWNRSAIRALRRHLGLTQAKFAREMGVRRQTVSEWENGVYEPDRSTAKHLELLAEQKKFGS